jgi:hypothetical protein
VSGDTATGDTDHAPRTRRSEFGWPISQLSHPPHPPRSDRVSIGSSCSRAGRVGCDTCHTPRATSQFTPRDFSRLGVLATIRFLTTRLGDGWFCQSALFRSPPPRRGNRQPISQPTIPAAPSSRSFRRLRRRPRRIARVPWMSPTDFHSTFTLPKSEFERTRQRSRTSASVRPAPKHGYCVSTMKRNKHFSKKRAEAAAGCLASGTSTRPSPGDNRAKG